MTGNTPYVKPTIRVTVAEVSLLMLLAVEIDPEDITATGDVSTDEIRALLYRLRGELPVTRDVAYRVVVTGLPTPEATDD